MDGQIWQQGLDKRPVEPRIEGQHGLTRREEGAELVAVDFPVGDHGIRQTGQLDDFRRQGVTGIIQPRTEAGYSRDPPRVIDEDGGCRDLDDGMPGPVQTRRFRVDDGDPP